MTNAQQKDEPAAVGHQMKKLRWELQDERTKDATIERLSHAIIAARGNLMDVARELGIGRRSLDRVLAEHPQLRKVTNVARAHVEDKMEEAPPTRR